MVNRDFGKYDIIIHEAGIPPIHTPQSTFRDMEPQIKNKLFLYHIATKDIDTKSGLKGIKHGIENTLVLISKTQNTQSEAIKLLDFLSSIQLFESMNVRSLKWMIDSLKSKFYSPGQVIVQEGDIGDSFFIIASGLVKIFSQTKGQEFQKIVQSGSYFGETALISHNQKRQASVMAITDVKVYYLLKHDFEFIFGVGGDSKKGSMLNKFKSLASARNSKILSVINNNTVLAELQ